MASRRSSRVGRDVEGPRSHPGVLARLATRSRRAARARGPPRRSCRAARGLDDEGFLKRCAIRLVDDSGEPTLVGQYEVVATAFIKKGESLPYPGVLVADDDDEDDGASESQSRPDDAAGARVPSSASPLRGGVPGEPPKPLDDVRWSCYTYAFHQSSDDDGPAAPAPSGRGRSGGPAAARVELWPKLTMDNPAPFINDACGPDRSHWYKRAKRQNVRYVEYATGDPATDWGVRIAATRDVQPGETLLADYGENYWRAWSQLFSPEMHDFQRLVTDLYGADPRRAGQDTAPSLDLVAEDERRKVPP